MLDSPIRFIIFEYSITVTILVVDDEIPVLGSVYVYVNV